jgi:pyruvate kinase
MRATKLMCTLGPASEARLDELVAAGMDVGRINCSHGTREDRDRLMAAVRRAEEGSGRPIGVLVDLAGPKVRLGELIGGHVTLVEGDRFVLRAGAAPGDREGASTTHPGLAGDLEPGDRLLLSDGAVELVVREAGREVVTEVVRGGTVRSRAGLNAPSERLGLPPVGERDREDAAWARDAGADWIGQSFVRRAEDVEQLRAVLGRDGPPVVAKIETRPAVEGIDRVLDAAEAIMVARGDLGAETPLEEIPVVQRDLVERATAAGVPVIVATQMLESMVDAPRPTRAEASDVATAVFQGADAIMLSGETAIGSYPVEAARTAGRIAEAAESLGARYLPPERPDAAVPDDPQAVADAAAEIARDGGAVAVACFTRTGRTAALLSSERPRVPIFALSPDPGVMRRLTLYHGVVPAGCRVPGDTDAMIALMEAGVREARLALPGEPVVMVTSSPFGTAHTNLLKIHRMPS